MECCEYGPRLQAIHLVYELIFGPNKLEYNSLGLQALPVTKHSSLLGSFVTYIENGVSRIWSQVSAVSDSFITVSELTNGHNKLEYNSLGLQALPATDIVAYWAHL